MTDNLDFEHRFRDRLVAHAALASRPFDPHRIATAATSGSAASVQIRRLRPMTLLAAALLLLVLAAAALTVGTALRWIGPDPGPLTWNSLPAMTTARVWHTATVLADGRVLVAGGQASEGGDPVASAEIFDPATSAWTPTGAMTFARAGHDAFLLPDGRVLVFGGLEPESRPEIWDPSTGEWAAIDGNLVIGGESAALLPDGRVLVAGAEEVPDGGRPHAAIMDLETGTWTQTESHHPRYNIQIVTLSDGALLLVGGDNLWAGGGATKVERYDPASNSWSVVGSLKAGTHVHDTTLLEDGRILAVSSGSLTTPFAQLFDPATGQTTVLDGPVPEWATDGGVGLADGRVLFAGERGTGSFDPTSERWVSLPPMDQPRIDATMSALPDGGVLIVGGRISPDGDRSTPSESWNTPSDAVELLR